MHFEMNSCPYSPYKESDIGMQGYWATHGRTKLYRQEMYDRDDTCTPSPKSCTRTVSHSTTNSAISLSSLCPSLPHLSVLQQTCQVTLIACAASLSCCSPTLTTARGSSVPLRPASNTSAPQGPEACQRDVACMHACITQPPQPAAASSAGLPPTASGWEPRPPHLGRCSRSTPQNPPRRHHQPAACACA